MARSPRGRIRQLAPTSDDPLTQAIAPPPDESEVARAERLRQEAEAKRISDDIDEELKRERVVWKKNKSLFKLLLLGQSESGALLALPPCPPALTTSVLPRQVDHVKECVLFLLNIAVECYPPMADAPS